MKNGLLFSSMLCAAQVASAQGALHPALPPGNGAPSPEETRQGMGIPSAGTLRGQRDIVGFASRADQMAKVWEWPEAAPAPEAPTVSGNLGDSLPSR